MRRCLLVALCACGLARADEPVWPGFRGEGARGLADTDVFTRLGEDDLHLDLQWTAPVGSGYSGIAVGRGLAVTLGQDGARDVAVAFDIVAGGERWRQDVGPTYRGHDGSFDGPLATPVIAGDVLFTLGPHGHLTARSLDTGAVRWQTDLVAEHGVRKPDYGFASSPVLVEGVLVVQPGPGDALVAGYDPNTGERLWAAGADRTEYQSPAVMDGLIVAAGVSRLISVDPRDGSVLWTYVHDGEGAHGAFSIVPVPLDSGRVLICHQQDAAVAVKGGRTPAAVWETQSLRKSYSVPVQAGGHLFGYSGFLLTCLDPDSGEERWRSRAPGDGFLIGADGHLILVTKRGRLHVARVSDEVYRERASLQVLEPPVWTLPSLAGDRIFLRGMHEIACVAVTAGTGPDARDELPDGEDTSPFARFLAEVATAERKREAVDRFLEDQDMLPVLEGSQTVHFLYRGEAQDMAIEGDMLGARQQVPMIRVPDTDLFYYTTRLESDARVNYLFVRDFVDILDPANPRTTSTTLFGPEMEVTLGHSDMPMSWVSMPEWTPPGYRDNPPGRVGRLVSRTVPSARIGGDVRIDVYLPPGYDPGETYPSLYVHCRGPALERGDWIRALDTGIGRDVEPLVVVFIEQPEPAPDHETYAAMVVEDLIPWTTFAYRLDPTAARRGFAGMGLYSYLSAYTALRYPGTVQRLGLQSLYMLDAMESRLTALLSNSHPGMTVYQEWGRYDLRSPDEAWDMRLVNQRMHDRFRDAGFSLHGGLVSDGAGWSSWRNRTGVLLRSLFPR